MSKYHEKCLCEPGRSSHKGMNPKPLHILHKSYMAVKLLGNAMVFFLSWHIFKLQCIMIKWIPGRLSLETGKLRKRHPTLPLFVISSHRTWEKSSAF